MQYQAIVRNSAGQAFSYYIVRVRTSILQGTSSGVSSYTETQLTNTDANGLIKIEIGAGTVVSGSLNSINWANGPYFIKTEIDPNGGINYTISSISQLLSTPYASVAKTSSLTSVNNGTLDQAYDYTNYKGEGRTIVADSGAVKIVGEDGILVSGTFGMGAHIEPTGMGTRFFFNPRRAAFRSGYVDGQQWDTTNTGLYSTAIGIATEASGESSFAAGAFTVSSGLSSTAIGSGTSEAIGNFSHAMGYHNSASGNNATSFGKDTKAIGIASTASGNFSRANGNYAASFGTGVANAIGSSVFGYNTKANGLYSTSVGHINDSIFGIQTSSPAYNPLFIVGCSYFTYDYYGSATLYRRNGLVVHNGGNVQLGAYAPAYSTNAKLSTFNCSIGSYFADTTTSAYSNNHGVFVQGKMGIGLSNPSSMLHIKSGTDASLLSHGLFVLDEITGPNLVMDNNEILARNNGTTSILSLQNGGGTVSIGVGSSSHILQIAGVGRSTSSAWATTSDKRVKKNITSVSNASLNHILKLRPVTYEWTDEYFHANAGLKKFNTGFISQELEQEFPEMIEKVSEKVGDQTIEDFRLLNLSDLPVQLTKAIQIQNELIKELKIKLIRRQELINQLSRK